ncbi:SURF1 family protein [Calidifontibacter sp. DB0510]|uniref:SURF1-like protein n=1 Tax=Metallococcus carri TaxID=1656884 RepID=A0A967B1M0_9MICO|nr:SURF1 family protein [Metallococcus carri]NHN56633.1 SURF1 family protein [Metallococcus carri]NOP38932.1 SURF1 family protein [Calidifontibacter sp. DB2511S]
MLRTALKPRWLGLFAVLVVIVVSFSLLGLWQLNVARDKGTRAAEKTTDRPRVALEQIVTPHQPFPKDGSLRKVTVRGRYNPGQQVLVSGRLYQGRQGYWVVTGFRVASTGATIPIVRGFVTTTSGIPAPTSAQVTLDGALAPGESPASEQSPPGQLSTVNLAELLSAWGGSFYNAFVFMTAERPAVTVAPVQPFPPPRPAVSGLQIRNLGYALQWWVFALFAVYIWWRMVRDDYRDGLRRRAAGNATADTPGDQPDSSTAEQVTMDADRSTRHTETTSS